MTPDEFREQVLPTILDQWEAGCFCASPGFRKLVSFNFDDYEIGPTGLADAEILIDAVIRKRFSPRKETDPTPHDRPFVCPQCQAVCSVFYDDYSISMYRSYATFADKPPPADRALYLIGWYGFKLPEPDAVPDFERTDSVEAFLDQLKTVGV